MRVGVEFFQILKNSKEDPLYNPPQPPKVQWRRTANRRARERRPRLPAELKALLE